MRLLILAVIIVVGVVCGDPAQACHDPCAASSSESGAPWWRYLVIFAGIIGLGYLWNWWFVPPAGVGFDPDDPDKLAAEREARRTLPLFWQAFENPALDEHDFLVKFNLTPHKDAEFIWAYELRRSNGVLYGKLANEPFEEGYESDQFYPIDETLIVDWTYTKGKEVKGHFITKVMMDRMPKRFAKKARKKFGWAPA